MNLECSELSSSAIVGWVWMEMGHAVKWGSGCSPENPLEWSSSALPFQNKYPSEILLLTLHISPFTHHHHISSLCRSEVLVLFWVNVS